MIRVGASSSSLFGSWLVRSKQSCKLKISTSSSAIYYSMTMTKPIKISNSPTDDKIFNKTVNINAPTSKVWETLTNPELMKKWMFETEINIITNWQVGSPITIRAGLHGMNFENTGTVLQFECEKILRYTHLSSLSRLLDQPENHTVLEFRLTPIENQTALLLSLSNFPTESIYKHLAYYWNITLEILKRVIEAYIIEGYGVEALAAEISQCIVLCANCHRRLTAKENNWYKRK